MAPGLLAGGVGGGGGSGGATANGKNANSSSEVSGEGIDCLMGDGCFGSSVTVPSWTCSQQLPSCFRAHVSHPLSHCSQVKLDVGLDLWLLHASQYTDNHPGSALTLPAPATKCPMHTQSPHFYPLTSHQTYCPRPPSSPVLLLQVKLDVDLDLSRCTALELRQLQHFVEACKHAAAATVPTAAAVDAKPAPAAAAADTKPAPAAAAAAVVEGKSEAAADAQQLAAVDAAVATDTAAAANAESKQQTNPPAAAAPAATTAGGPAAATAAGGALAAAAGGSSSAAAAADARSILMSGFPLAGPSEVSLSEHAGISWPGVLVGAGLKPCSRMHLAGNPDKVLTAMNAAAAAAVAAAAGAAAGAGGLTGHQSMLLPPRPSVAFAGLKRRSSGG